MLESEAFVNQHNSYQHTIIIHWKSPMFICQVKHQSQDVPNIISGLGQGHGQVWLYILEIFHTPGLPPIIVNKANVIMNYNIGRSEGIRGEVGEGFLHLLIKSKSYLIAPSKIPLITYKSKIPPTLKE